MNLDAIKQSGSASFKKKNPHIFGMHGMIGAQPVEHAMSIGTECDATVKPKPKKKRIRQSEKPLLNNLEAEWFLRIQHLGVRPQAVKFKIANNAFYKVDFFSVRTLTAWEVKGPREGKNVARGILTLKCAATAWPEIKFILVWKDEQGQWQEQHVLP